MKVTTVITNSSNNNNSVNEVGTLNRSSDLSIKDFIAHHRERLQEMDNKLRLEAIKLMLLP